MTKSHIPITLRRIRAILTRPSLRRQMNAYRRLGRIVSMGHHVDNEMSEVHEALSTLHAHLHPCRTEARNM